MRLSRSSSAEKQPNKPDKELLLLGAKIFLTMLRPTNRQGEIIGYVLSVGRNKHHVSHYSGFYSMGVGIGVGF